MCIRDRDINFAPWEAQSSTASTNTNEEEDGKNNVATIASDIGRPQQETTTTTTVPEDKDKVNDERGENAGKGKDERGGGAGKGKDDRGGKDERDSESSTTNQYIARVEGNDFTDKASQKRAYNTGAIKPATLSENNEAWIEDRLEEDGAPVEEVEEAPVEEIVFSDPRLGDHAGAKKQASNKAQVRKGGGSGKNKKAIQTAGREYAYEEEYTGGSGGGGGGKKSKGINPVAARDAYNEIAYDEDAGYDDFFYDDLDDEGGGDYGGDDVAGGGVGYAEDLIYDKQKGGKKAPKAAARVVKGEKRSAEKGLPRKQSKGKRRKRNLELENNDNNDTDVPVAEDRKGSNIFRDYDEAVLEEAAALIAAREAAARESETAEIESDITIEKISSAKNAVKNVEVFNGREWEENFFKEDDAREQNTDEAQAKPRGKDNKNDANVEDEGLNTDEADSAATEQNVDEAQAQPQGKENKKDATLEDVNQNIDGARDQNVDEAQAKPQGKENKKDATEEDVNQNIDGARDQNVDEAQAKPQGKENKKDAKVEDESQNIDGARDQNVDEAQAKPEGKENKKDAKVEVENQNIDEATEDLQNDQAASSSGNEVDAEAQEESQNIDKATEDLDNDQAASSNGNEREADLENFSWEDSTEDGDWAKGYDAGESAEREQAAQQNGIARIPENTTTPQFKPQDEENPIEGDKWVINEWLTTEKDENQDATDPVSESDPNKPIGNLRASSYPSTAPTVPPTVFPTEDRSDCHICPGGRTPIFPERPIMKTKQTCQELAGVLDFTHGSKCGEVKSNITIDLAAYCGCEAHSFTSYCSFCPPGTINLYKDVSIPTLQFMTCGDVELYTTYITDQVTCESMSRLSNMCCGTWNGYWEHGDSETEINRIHETGDEANKGNGFDARSNEQGLKDESYDWEDSPGDGFDPQGSGGSR